MAKHPDKVTAKGTHLPLIDLKGKPYLQVAHRIVWFREEHPEWQIITEFHTLDTDKGIAICRAQIETDKGQMVQQATKCETRKGFPDFIEKAETGAIGRALALIGYGTQFEPEFDEGERLADAPIPVAKKGVSLEPLKPDLVKDLHASFKLLADALPKQTELSLSKEIQKKFKKKPTEWGKEQLDYINERIRKLIDERTTGADA